MMVIAFPESSTVVWMILLLLELPEPELVPLPFAALEFGLLVISLSTMFASLSTPGGTTPLIELSACV